MAQCRWIISAGPVKFALQSDRKVTYTLRVNCCLQVHNTSVRLGRILNVTSDIVILFFLITCETPCLVCMDWLLSVFLERTIIIIIIIIIITMWWKLHNEELSDLYSLPNVVRVVKSRRMRCAGHVARMGEGRRVHRVLVGKPEGKRPFERSRCRWEDNTVEAAYYNRR